MRVMISSALLLAALSVAPLSAAERATIAQERGCSQAAFSPDSRLLATVDGFPAATPGGRQITITDPAQIAELAPKIRLWDVASGKPAGIMEHSKHDVAGLTNIMGMGEALAFSPDGKTLAVASDGAVRLWDVATRKETKNLGVLLGFGFKPPALPAGVPNVLPEELPGMGMPVQSMAFSPDGRYLAVSASIGVAVVELATGKSRNLEMQGKFIQQNLPGGGISGSYQSRPDAVSMDLVAYSADGKNLICGRSDGMIRVLSVETGKVLRTVGKRWKNPTRDDHARAQAVSSDGSLAAVTDQGSVHLLDLRTGKTLRTIKGVKNVFALDFAPDGQTIAMRDLTGTIRLFDVGSGKSLATLHAKPAGKPRSGPRGTPFPGGGDAMAAMPGTRALMFCPDGKTLASLTFFLGPVQLWDVPTAGGASSYRSATDPGRGPAKKSADR